MSQRDTNLISTERRRFPIDWMAFSWGLLEAVTLFIVPDTWITRQALISRRAGLIAASWALVGAMIGGTALYLVAARYHAEILAFYDWLPGIGPTLTAKAASELQDKGLWALFMGGYTGTPFKLFAAQANSAGIGLLAFAGAAVLSRGSRFVLASLFASLVGKAAKRANISLRAVLCLHAIAWAVFYAWYWWQMSEYSASAAQVRWLTTAL